MMRFSRRTRRHIVLEAVDIPVSGERHHDDNIRRVLVEHGRGGFEHLCTATIRRDRTNQFDPHAVEVIVHGLRVGYISHAASERVAERIGDGSVEVECAVSWNGERTNGIYHVKLFPIF